MMSGTTFHEGWETERTERLSRLDSLHMSQAAIRKPDATIQLRLAESNELGLVHAIIQAAFAEYVGQFDPPSSALSETLEDVRRKAGEGGAVIAWEGETAIGATLFTLRPDYFYVGRLAVLPDRRGRGVATAILDYCEQMALCLGCSQIGLGTRAKLEGNVALYRRLGYRIDKIITHPHGTDQVVWLLKTLARE